MKIGILYDANNYYLCDSEKDFSLLSEVTKIKRGLEDNFFETELIEGIDGLISSIVQNLCQLDLIVNLVTWTRSNKILNPVDLLKYYGIPYIGNSSKSMIICADKYISKLIAMELGIPVPKYLYESTCKSFVYDYQYIAQTLKVPFVMKANGTSGSLGLKLINTKAEFKQAQAEFNEKWNMGILYEEYIVGTDITIPVLQTNGVAHALQIIKYLDSQNNDIPFFTRQIKYYEDIHSIIYDNFLNNPEQVKEYALLIHNQLGCRLFSRSDFRLTPEGNYYFLECNASPDLNPHGAFVNASKMEYEQLLLHLINEAMSHK